MKHLHELVIPNIHTHWKQVATCLTYSQYEIKMMDEEWKGVNSIQCCEDLLRDWLCKYYCVHPRSWETLINSVKQVQELSASTKQIERNVEKLIR